MRIAEIQQHFQTAAGDLKFLFNRLETIRDPA